MGSWSQGGQGAIGGAMTGAALGSIVPGVGTGLGALAGGVLGGLGGMFGDDGASAYQDQFKQLAAQYAGMQAPQMGPASQAGYSDFRSNQAGLIAQLEAMAAGNGPSAATMQMREAMDRAAGAQASAAAGAGGRGVNAGAALRQATNNTAALQAQSARDTGLMRVQEQLGATQQLGNVIAQGRGADEGVNTFNAAQQNTQAQANLEAKLRTLGISSQAQLNALMAAAGVAGPGFGTQLLAGGASAFPAALQFANRGGGPGGGTGSVASAFGQFGGMGSAAGGWFGGGGGVGAGPDGENPLAAPLQGLF